MISVRRGSWPRFAAAGLLVAMGAGLLLATSDHLVDPIAFGLQVAVISSDGSARRSTGWFDAPAIASVSRFSRWRSPRPPCRCKGATRAALHSIGVLAIGPSFAPGLYVIFAFPEGRLGGRLDGRCSARLSLWTLASFLPSLLFSPVVSGQLALAGCNAACPANGFMIADRPTIADGLLGRDITAYLPVRGLLRNSRLT